MSITKKSKLTAILLLIIVCLAMSVACSAGDGNFYTVKFESNGGTQYSEVVAEGGTRVNLPTPEKTDSEFVGWYLNPEFEGDIASGAYAVTGDVTLYAKWNTKTYNVKFESNGGTQYSEVLVESGTRVNLPTPERYASIFSGWYLNPEFLGEPVEGDYGVLEDVTFYAKWEIVSYTVRFDSNGGTSYYDLVLNGEAVELPTPEKEDHYFLGWYDNAEFEGEALGEIYAPNSDITIYAKWKFAYAKITFDSNGGTTVDSIYLAGQTTDLAIPFKYGYKFMGWYDNAELEGEAITSCEGIVSDTVLYAKWSEVTYVYMYYGTIADYYRFEYTNGDVITVEELYALFTPEDLIVADIWGKLHNAPFMYWAYEGETESSHVKITDSITVGTEHIIIVAQYDYSNVPANANLTYYEETDTYVTTGRVAHVFFDYGTPYGTYSMTLQFRKNAGGGVGPAFKMKMPNTSKQYEADCYYIAAGLCPSTDTAKLQISNVQNGWAHASGSLKGGLATSKWGQYYAGLEENAMATVTMKVVITETDFFVYVYDFGGETTEEELLYKYSDYYSDTAFMDSFEGTGFGLRSSTTGTIISNLNYLPAYQIEFDQKYGEDATKLLYTGELSKVTALDSGVLFADENDKNSAYYDKFIGWALTENGEIITEITSGDKLYAVYEKVELNTVTFDGANGQPATYSYYKEGETLVLPADEPFKNGEEIDGALIGYYFKEWQYNGTTAPDGMTISGDITLVAVYSSHNAYTVNFVIDAVTLEGLVIADGEQIVLPQPERENHRFGGWYLDQAFEIAYENVGVTENLTLYGKWIETIEITFVSEGETISLQTIDKGAVVTLPENPTKQSALLQTGNLLTYTFAKWTVDNQEITSKTIFTENTTVTAEFSVTETRNGTVVIRDENGNVTYRDTGFRVGSTGVTVEAYDFYEAIREQVVGEAYQVSYTLTIGKFTTESSPEIRLFFLGNPAGYLTDGTLGRLEIDGTGSQAVPFFNYYPTSGRINFGAKISGTSAQPVQGAVSLFADSKYYTYWNSLNIGDKVEFDIRFVYGIYEDGSVWFKFYIFDEILYTYGLTADEGTTNYVGGERVFGKIIQSSDLSSHTKLQSYLLGEGGTIGTSHGIWTWKDLNVIGGITSSNIVNEKLSEVTFVNDSERVTMYLANGKTITYTLANSEEYQENGRNYYDEFKGWSLTENGELVTTVSENCTLYAVYEKVEILVPLVNISFTVDGVETNSTSVQQNSAIGELPTATKESETLENGNLLSYAFEGWYLDEQLITEESTFTSDSVLVAQFAVTETRNNMTVNRDENGNVTYTHNNNTTGTIDDSVSTDWTTHKAYEINHTVTYASWAKASGNYRLAFFVVNDGMNFNGVAGEKTVWFNLQPSSGTIIFGTKINNSSKNNYQTGIGSISSDCPYKTAYNALETGKPATFNFKIILALVQTGTSEEGEALYTANIKIYLSINGSEHSLLYTYGHVEDSEGTSTVNGEKVWGKICTDDNYNVDNTNFLAYLKDQPLSNFGTKIGIWAWQATSANGGALISNVVTALD